jgi:hypothetical protein
MVNSFEMEMRPEGSMGDGPEISGIKQPLERVPSKRGISVFH